MKKQPKLYGRKKINKLDLLLAAVAVVIGVAALWISIGISVRNAGAQAAVAFRDLAVGLGFVFNVGKYGEAVVVAVFVTVIFYSSLLCLIIGTIYLIKKKLNDRVPGLVAQFVAAIGICFYFCFAYELLGGSASFTVNIFWPILLSMMVGILICLMVFAIWATFNTKYNVELDAKPVEEAAPVEEKVEEQPAPVEEKVEEVVEEEEEAEEEEEEIEEEAEQGEEDDIFSKLGKRRKRIPFQKRIAKCDPDTKDRYKMIVNALNEYEFNDRISIPGETFSYKRERLIFLTFSGKTLKAHFKLSPRRFEDSPIPAKDASDVKKYEDIPMYLKIKSDLAARRVIALGRELAEKHEVPKK